MHSQSTTPGAAAGVSSELGAIADRRARALDLWDGPIQSLWGALLWYQEQSRRQADLIVGGNRSPSVAAAFTRCLDEADRILEAIGSREAEARAQVRGMDQFIASARQASRSDALAADLFRRLADGQLEQRRVVA